jgi:hypothetical protein
MLHIKLYEVGRDNSEQEIVRHSTPFCQWFNKDVENFVGMPGYYPPTDCPTFAGSRAYGPYPVRLKKDFEERGFGPITPGRYRLDLVIEKDEKRHLMHQSKMIELVDNSADDFLSVTSLK